MAEEDCESQLKCTEKTKTFLRPKTFTKKVIYWLLVKTIIEKLYKH